MRIAQTSRGAWVRMTSATSIASVELCTSIRWLSSEFAILVPRPGLADQPAQGAKPGVRVRRGSGEPRRSGRQPVELGRRAISIEGRIDEPVDGQLRPGMIELAIGSREDRLQPFGG